MNVKAHGIYVDGTAGSGGHSAAILERMGGTGRLLAIDRDMAAVERTKERLQPWVANSICVQGRFSDIAELAEQYLGQPVDGVLLDLGVSSNQIDDPERGFSFQSDGPLDMRMDRNQKLTAADIVNNASEESLAEIFWRYGEESDARSVARFIVRERARDPIETTAQLASVVERAKKGRRGRIHPATKVFQGLRIAVNGELEQVERALPAALSILRPGGRLLVISFHSLEDRLVKQFFARHSGRWESLQQGGQRWVGELPAVRLLLKKSLQPSLEEQKENPRARSARLRAAERVEHEPR